MQQHGVCNHSSTTRNEVQVPYTCATCINAFDTLLERARSVYADLDAVLAPFIRRMNHVSSTYLLVPEISTSDVGECEEGAQQATRGLAEAEKTVNSVSDLLEQRQQVIAAATYAATVDAMSSRAQFYEGMIRDIEIQLADLDRAVKAAPWSQMWLFLLSKAEGCDYNVIYAKTVKALGPT